MKKITLLFIAIFFNVAYVTGQGVYVTISTVIDSNAIFKCQSMTIDNPQYLLKVTYENRTDSAIYLDKVIKDVQISPGIGVPLFRGMILSNPPILSLSSTFDYSKDTIFISVPLGPNDTWSAFYDSSYSSLSRNHILDADLEIYYDSLYYSLPSNTYLYSKKGMSYQTHSSARYKNLINDFMAHKTDSLIHYDDFFVFLRPGEMYSDLFDMRGFAFFKGHYLFTIRRNFWTNSIVVGVVYDEELEHYVQVSVPYPDSVDSYRLYKGTIISNIFSIDL